MAVLILNTNSMHIPLADQSVHCVVTSPPYYGLRSYLDTNDPNKPNELGLEPTPEEYIANMVAVFREVKRVLRDDGTLWLNIGDSFASGKGTCNNPGGGSKSYIQDKQRYQLDRGNISTLRKSNLKPKDTIGIPWMLAFALRADGWYLRSDIIWHKPNPMPESVTDRPTKAHEYLFLLTKRARYYYDADAVREAIADSTANDSRLSADGYKTKRPERGYPGTPSNGSGLLKPSPSGRNRRSVWTIATEATPCAHFATFPRALVEPCIKAGTSERGVCPVCGAPWERVIKTTRENYISRNDRQIATGGAQTGGVGKNFPDTKTTTVGWRPTCDHDARPVPATVLDPFGGSGTTAIVARQLGRNAVMCDLSFSYLSTIARKRLGFDALDEWTNGVPVEGGNLFDLPLFQEETK